MTPDIHSPSDSELTIVDLLGMAWKGWKILVITIFVGAVVGAFIAKWQLQVFQANAILQVDTDSRSMNGMDQLQDIFGASSKAETEIEIIQSRMVLMPVVDSLHLNLYASPKGLMRRLLGQQGRVLLSNLVLPEPRSKKEKPWTLTGIDSVTMTLRAPNGDSICVVPQGQLVEHVLGRDTLCIRIEEMRADQGERFVLGIDSTSDVAGALLKQLFVSERGKKTGILALSFQNRYSDRAAIILNEIVRSYLRQNIDAKSAEAQKTLTFLEQQLPAVKARLDSADSALNAFRLAKGTIDLTTEARLALDQQVELEQNLLALQQKKQELVRLYKEDHPQVIALNAQMDKIRQVLGKSATQVKALPATQQEVLKLTRDVTVATEFYQTMLEKIQQLQVVRAGEVGSARLIDLAQVPGSPIKPNRKLLFLVGVFGGFAVGFVFLFLRRTMDKGVKDVAQIERLAQSSVFAQIPTCEIELKNSRKSGVRDFLVHEIPDDLSVESLRSLRTALEFSLLSQGGKVLTITGLIPGVGKSFVSVNLAALFSVTNRKVLLIDADLRKGRLHAHFDGSRTPGLSEVLSGQQNLEVALRQHPDYPNLYFLPSGQVPPNPSEMLGSAQLGNLIAELRQQYDLVVLDTSPILLVTDPALVLRHADHAILVLEHGRHPGSDIQEGMKLLRIREALNTSIVLNKCEGDLAGYGRYGRYGKYGKLKLEKSRT